MSYELEVMIYKHLKQPWKPKVLGVPRQTYTLNLMVVFLIMSYELD